LSQYLTGKATDTYTRLSTEERKDYKKVKEALLHRYNLTEKGYRKKLRESQAEQDETPQQLIVRLASYLDNWVELSSCKDLRELILQEQFITSCPFDLSTYLRERKINNLESLAETADRCLRAHDRKLSYIAKITPDEEDTKTSSEVTDHLYQNKGHTPYQGTKNTKYCTRCKMSNHNTSECKRVHKPAT